MPGDKSLPEEMAKLTEAVHELRDREVVAELQALRDEIGRLRAEKDTPPPGCCGHHHCGCIHWYWPHPTYPYTVTYTSPTYTQPTITTGTGTNTWGGTTSVTTNAGPYTIIN